MTIVIIITIFISKYLYRAYLVSLAFTCIFLPSSPHKNATTTRRFGIVISARISKRDEKKLHHMQIKLKTLPLTKNIKHVGVTPVASLSYLFKQWNAVLGKIEIDISSFFP